MAKQGMKRPDRTHTQPKNQVSPVPELQGKAKSGKEKAKAAAPDASEDRDKVFRERPISSAYRAFDNELARDNLENDIPAADLQDL